jgi:hypothetical protein
MTNSKAWLAAGIAGIAGIAIAGIVPQDAWSHHSFAMYDRTRTETLTGKLTRFIPGANHAQIIFELIGPDGEAVLGKIRGFELASWNPRSRGCGDDTPIFLICHNACNINGNVG